MRACVRVRVCVCACVCARVCARARQLEWVFVMAVGPADGGYWALRVAGVAVLAWGVQVHTLHPGGDGG